MKALSSPGRGLIPRARKARIAPRSASCRSAVGVVTLNDDPALVDYATGILKKLRGEMVRAEADFGTDPVKAKIAEAEKARVHTMLVVGPRDMEAGNVSVRLHGKGNLGAKPKDEVVAGILESIRERKG